MDNKRGHLDLVGSGLIVLSSVQLACIIILAKFLTSSALSVPFILAFRFLLSAVLLAGLMLVLREPLQAVRGERSVLIVLGAGFYGLAAVCYYVALGHGQTSALALIAYSYPVFVVVGSIAFGDGFPAPLVVLSIFLAVIGVALIVWTPGMLSVEPIGAVLALASGMAYAGYLLGSGRYIHRTRPITSALWASTSAGIVLLTYSLATSGIRMPQRGQWAMLVALALLSAGAFYCLFRGINRIGPVKSSVLGTAEPLSTASLAILILHDRPSVVFAFGAPLILAGAVLASLARTRPPRKTV
jgi:drug/metabolite transporter (DMT)-like permease